MATKNYLLFLVLLIAQLGFAQQRWAVRFSDKNNSPFSINNPQQFLSQKAIDRRAKHNILVTTDDIPVNQNYIDSVLSKGGTYINKSKWMNLVVVKVVDTTIYNSVMALPFVSSVEVIKRHDTLTTNKRADKFEMEEEKSLDYGFGDNQIKIMQGDFLHESGYQGEEMTIAVLDAGFTNVNTISAFNHLWNENRILGYWDFVNNNDNVFDKHDHGTKVLSTMAANLPEDLIGTAPKAKYWLLRTEDAPTETISEEYNWLAAAEFADSAGVDVINSSLGYTTFDDASQNHTYADMDGNTTIITKAADMAYNKGMIVVNSAGNSGNNSWYYIGAPADGKHVLSVGATEHNGSLASFSSRGPTVDGRLKPNVVTIGQNSAVVDENGNVVYNNGTSFSSPEMAGMVAVLWQVFPEKTNNDIIDAVQRSAHKFKNPDNDMGYGIPNFRLAYLHLAGYNIDDINTNQVLSIYPQPFHNQFNLVYYSAVSQVIQVNIFDVAGKLVYSYNWTVGKGLIEETCVRTALTSGVYTLQIIDGAGVAVTNKIVRQ